MSRKAEKTKKNTARPDKTKRIRLIQRQPNRPRRAVTSGRKGKS